MQEGADAKCGECVHPRANRPVTQQWNTPLISIGLIIIRLSTYPFSSMAHIILLILIWVYHKGVRASGMCFLYTFVLYCGKKKRNNKSCCQVTVFNSITWSFFLRLHSLLILSSSSSFRHRHYLGMDPFPMSMSTSQSFSVPNAYENFPEVRCQPIFSPKDEESQAQVKVRKPEIGWKSLEIFWGFLSLSIAWSWILFSTSIVANSIIVFPIIPSRDETDNINWKF